ncbi:MAG: shikimate kinase [Clostridiales bacterium]|nr:shikimate kinase [Clostridiales bacterium]
MEKIYGLIGRKLGHSYSVPIHEQLGNPKYKLYELEPDEVEAFLRRDDIGAMNVTIPYKKDAYRICDILSDQAKAIGSVNTVVRLPDGRLSGYNTDIFGFEYMAKKAGIDFCGKKVVVFGSGGSSLTAQAASKEMGAREVIVVSRTGQNNYENLHLHSDAQILVNTTPVGMYPNTGVFAADPELFPKCEGALDLIYNPCRTAFILKAQALGIPCIDGLPMLVAQGVLADAFFFDKKMNEEDIERILLDLRKNMMNIVIVGMPGSGKTTIANELARITGRRIIDVDKVIEQRAGCDIPTIFAEKGEAAFREMERDATAWAGMQSGCIISTGGGVVKDERNYPSLHQNGRIYHISRDINKLAREGRPLSQSGDLEKMASERAPMYARFADKVIENDSSIQVAATSIWSDYCENSGY